MLHMAHFDIYYCPVHNFYKITNKYFEESLENVFSTFLTIWAKIYIKLICTIFGTHLVYHKR